MKVKPVIHPFRKPNCQLLPGRRRKLDSSTPYPVLVYALAGVYGGAATTDDANDHRRCHYPLDEARMHCVSTAIRHCEFQILKAKKKSVRENHANSIFVSTTTIFLVFFHQTMHKNYTSVFFISFEERTLRINTTQLASLSLSLSLFLSLLLLLRLWLCDKTIGKSSKVICLNALF